MLLLARQTAIQDQTKTSVVFRQDATGSGYMVLKDSEVIWTAELTHDYQFGGTSTPETVVFAANGTVRPEGYEIDILSQKHRTRLRFMIDGAGFATTTLENIETSRQRN